MTRREASHQLLTQAMSQLAQASKLLQRSYEKAIKLDLESLSDADYDVLDAFTSRFGRTSDIFVRKVLRMIHSREALDGDATMKDLLNFGEKVGLIASVEAFEIIRELRNEITHEYSARDFITLLREVIELTPTLLEAAKNALARSA